MLCWGQKSTKIDPTSFQKQLSNPCSNLHRFESQLDSILGGFWGSRWSPIGPKSLQKSIPKTIQKTITFLIASGSIFDRFWAPTWGVQGGPLGVRRATFSPLEPLLEPRCAKDLPKIPQDLPRPLQDASWDQFLTILGPNLVVFRANSIDFRPPTWWIVQPTNKPNSQSANQPTSQRNHTSRHPFIPGPGAGWPKAIGYVLFV